MFDESPKRNIHINSDDWFGEGQGKLPDGSEVVFHEQLDGLNPSNGLLEKSTSSIHDKLASNAQGKQQGNVDEMPKKITTPKSSEQSKRGEKKCVHSELWHACASQSSPLVCLPIAGSRVVYFPQGHSEQLICQLQKITIHADVETDEVYAQMTLQPLSPPEQKDISLPADWIPKNHGWKLTKPFCFIVFDLGGMLFLLKWLLPYFHTNITWRLKAMFLIREKLMSMNWG